MKYWLGEHGFDADDDELCRAIFEHAKAANSVLSEAEIRAVIEECRSRS